MKPKSDLSRQLYELMLQRGYEENFCDIVTKNLNTDFTASRMIGYLYHYDHPPVEEIADEMISILSDRNRIMQKKELEEIFVLKNYILFSIPFALFMVLFSALYLVTYIALTS